MHVSLRRATPDDVSFLADLASDPDVAPFLAAVRASTPEAVADAVERSTGEPESFGVLVIEVDGARAGTATWELVNRRSRIGSVSGFAIDPALRGRGVGVAAARAVQRHLIREAGLHRLQMEVYGFNERALRHAERAGWVREGVRRRAYWRHDTWVDGVLFGLVDDELDDGWAVGRDSVSDTGSPAAPFSRSREEAREPVGRRSVPDAK